MKKQEKLCLLHNGLWIRRGDSMYKFAVGIWLGFFLHSLLSYNHITPKISIILYGLAAFSGLIGLIIKYN